MKTTLLIVFVFLFPAFLASQTPACNWSGTWSTNWGSMQLMQVGDSVWGNYSHDAGRINGRVAGTTLSGVWSESPSYAPSHDAGKFSFTLSTDCKSFSGGWRYGLDADNMTGGWTGTRSGFSATGRITNGGKGIAGVAVRTGSFLAVTDENGYFSLNGLPNGTHTLTLEKSGYTFTPANAQITVDNSNVTAIAVAGAPSGGDTPGPGCSKTIHTENRSYTGDFSPPILTATNGVASARFPNGKLFSHYAIEPWYCYVRSSTDNGVSWSAPIRTEDEPNASGTSVILVGKDGVIHLADQFNVGTYYKRSTDGGATWSDPFYLHDQGWGDWDYGAQIAFDGSDNLHAVYYSAFGWSDPPFNIKWRMSTDQGVTWKTEQTLTSIPNEDASGYGASSTALAAGPGNRLYVVYVLQSSVTPQKNKLRMLTYNGSTWDNGIDVSGEFYAVGGHDIVVDDQGKVHIIYSYGDDTQSGWTNTLAYRTITNGSVSQEKVLASNFNHVWTTSLGIVDGQIFAMIGKADFNTKRGAGVYALNISEGWPCPAMVSSTTGASTPNLPWMYYDVRPANTWDVTWTENDGTNTWLVMCDASTFTQRPCGGTVVEGPGTVNNDSVSVIITQISTDAVGYPIDFPVVDLNVSVAESQTGMLGNLTRDNFKLFEDGVEQHFSLTSVGRQSIDTAVPTAAVMVIDNSTAIPDSIRAALIELVRGLKDNMNDKWQISIVKYADRVQKMIDFTNDANALLTAAAAPGPVSDQAVIMSAVTEAINMCVARTEPTRLVMVLTSGLISDPQFTAFATQQASSKSIPVYVLGVTDTKADPALRALADRSGGKMFTKGDDMDEVDESSAATIGNAYQLHYTTTNAKRDGSSRAVKVVMSAPLKTSPSTIITRSDVKTYRAPVNNSNALISFNPTRTTLPPSTSSSAATVAVWVENIADTKGLMGAEVHIEFDPAKVEFVSARPGEFLSPPPTDILSDLTNTGQVAQGKITINIVRVGGQPAGVQGTGPLYYLSFKARTADAMSTLRITTVNLRNSVNAAISSKSVDGELISLTAPAGPGAGVGNVYTNHNTSDPSSGSALSPTFTLTEPFVITRVATLHATGKSPGQISIKNDVTGETYGPWNTTGGLQGGVSNATWTATMETTLPAGIYIVVDSDPASWTFNNESDMRGIVWVDGRKQNPSKPVDHRGSLLGDFDGNNLVNFPDYTVFVSYWNSTNLKGDMVSPIIGEPPGAPPFTIETYPYRGEGTIDFEDQIVFAQMYNWTRGFAKVVDLRDQPLGIFRLQTVDKTLLAGERELVLQVHDAQYVLGTSMVISVDERTLRTIHLELGDWMKQQAPQAQLLVRQVGSGLLVTIVGFGATEGLHGSGALIRIRYRADDPNTRIAVLQVDARDVSNRKMHIAAEDVEDATPPVVITPIPASESIHLVVNTGHIGAMTVSAVNAVGQVVLTLVDNEIVDLTLDRTLDVRQLPTGIYFIRIEQSDVNTAVALPIVR